MHAVLRKVGAVPPNDIDDELVRLWARDVRESSYDMEDILDTFLVRVEGGKPTDDAAMVKRLKKKMGDLFSLSKAKARHEIAGAINALSKQLEDIAKLRGRYTVEDVVPKPAATTSIDARLSALYTKVSQLIGFDEPRDKLISMLSTVDSNKEMKIVAVIGFGGLGKTTLARTVYEKLTASDPPLYYKAFIPVGRNPDLKKVLRDILIELDKEHYTMGVNLTVFDERQLINELREFLKDKRYFIVIDDIWDVPSWNTIRYALDKNGLENKVVITTRNRDIAEEVGCSYKMERLPSDSSKILFYGRIFGSEDKCPRKLVEVSEKILKKCGGVPLALITTSSLLANRSRNIKQWYEVCDSIGYGLGSNNDIDNMRKILSLSYYDLPPHLKTCLLYLSIFPEDFEICNYRLIWRWVAEDFIVPGGGGQNLFEIGESYIKELLNRSLIQPARLNYEGIPQAFHVHDMVLDLICSLSREKGFVTSVLRDRTQSKPSSGSKVRRLSLYNNTTWPTTMSTSKLRSLTLLNPPVTNSMLSSISCCHLLRVLDLEGCNLEDHTSLWFVGDLFHLRYLSLAYTRYAGELPVEIGKLHFLQTLDIYGTDMKELPSSILALRQLMCLYVSEHTRLPKNGLRNLTSIEVLLTACVDLGYVAAELGYLVQLRELIVKINNGEDEGGEWDDSLCITFVQSLGKLHKIQDLYIDTNGVAVDLKGSVESLGNLRSLCINKMCRLPSWINHASLVLLSWLDITVVQLQREDIQVLGMLPAIRLLIVTVAGNVTKPALMPSHV